MSAISPRYIVEIRDIILNPSEEYAYKTLKVLLEYEEIGYRKPSQFLRHLRSIADRSVVISCERFEWAAYPCISNLTANDRSFGLAGGHRGCYCKGNACPSLQIAENAQPSTLSSTGQGECEHPRSKTQSSALMLDDTAEGGRADDCIWRSIEVIGRSNRDRENERHYKHPRLHSRGHGYALNGMAMLASLEVRIRWGIVSRSVPRNNGRRGTRWLIVKCGKRCRPFDSPLFCDRSRYEDQSPSQNCWLFSITRWSFIVARE